ncbi:MAG: hypothetical protein HGA54_00290 [Actinobacteria bacterium]|nr:hypothetical protein [Actinomycetota bacterium]
MIRNKHRLIIVVVFMCLFAITLTTGCAQNKPADTSDASGTSATAATATDTESKPSEEAVVEAPAKASYDGTDPAVILETYCALSGCHDSESLLNYSDTESAVTRKMQSMCGDEDYALLTDAQTQAMIDFYLAKTE